jgi:hypothetical protein
MGTDASSMKDNAMNSENHTTEEKNSFNHMNHSIEQNQMKIETEAMQDVKVEKKTIAELYYYYYYLYFCRASYILLRLL